MKRLPNRLNIALFLLMLGLVTSVAAAPLAPQALVKNTTGQMLKALKEHRAVLQRDSGKIYDLVDEILLPHFDFETMARWVLGKYWRQASPEQRRRFTEEFRTLLVRTYAKVLLEYSNEQIRYLPTPATPPDRENVTVRTEVQPKSGPVIAVNYRMHRKDDSWKAYDVTVDGVSLVTNYRGSFSRQIREKGMDSLIVELGRLNTKGGG